MPLSCLVRCFVCNFLAEVDSFQLLLENSKPLKNVWSVVQNQQGSRCLHWRDHERQAIISNEKQSEYHHLFCFLFGQERSNQKLCEAARTLWNLASTKSQNATLLAWLSHTLTANKSRRKKHEAELGQNAIYKEVNQVGLHNSLEN